MKRIVPFLVLIIFFLVGSIAGKETLTSEQMEIGQKVNSEKFEWKSYFGFLSKVSWAKPERATKFNINDFSLQSPVVLTKISHVFFEHAAHGWGVNNKFKFRVYDEDGSTLLFESEFITAVKNTNDGTELTPTEYSLPAPLVLSSEFYISVVPDAETGYPSGAAQYAGSNASHSYTGNSEEWEKSPEEWSTAIFVEEGVDNEAPEFISLSGNKVNVGMAMPLEIMVADVSGIETIIAKYTIGDGNEQELAMEVAGGKSDEKSVFVYTGQLAAENSVVSGNIRFVMKDSEGNEAVSENFSIDWIEDTINPAIEMIDAPTEVYYHDGGEVSALLSDGSDIFSAELYYTINGVENSITMEFEPNSSYYSAVLPAKSIGTTGSYYLKVIDNSTNNNSSDSEIIEVEWTSTVIHLNDSFESYENFVTSFSPWILHDLDNEPTIQLYSLSYPNLGEKMAFMIYNPLETHPHASAGSPYLARTGDKYAAGFNAAESGQSNDWIIAPKITLGASGIVSFWARSVYDSFEFERFRVGISLEGTEEDDFEIISEGEYVVTTDAWTEYNFDLSEYEGESIYIGINCVTKDGLVFMLDDIKITSSIVLGIDDDLNFAEKSAELFQNYPNPFNPTTEINYEVQSAGTVQLLVHNNRGELVQSLVNKRLNSGKYSVSFDGSSLNSGVYFYSLIQNGISLQTKKMIMLK